MEVVSVDETHDSDNNAITSPTAVADETHGNNAITSPTAVDDETHDSNGFSSPTPLDDETHVVNESEELVQTPALGMTFRSWEEVEKMYKLYGKAKGFGIARTQAARNINKERRCVTWKCECWGMPNMMEMSQRQREEAEMEIGGTNVFEKPKVRKRKSKKCGCRALVYASVNSEEMWEVKKVILEHTGHNPKPVDSRSVKEYRMQSFTSNMRKRVLNDVDVGVPIDQIHGSIARERDGLANMPVTPKDMRNVADEARKLKIEGGDSLALMAYLDRMRRDNNDFFYSIRMDITGGLQDVFWVDARSKAAYEEFGDVVCFDTTYMTNDYELPFANFVGVNHHAQTTLFGCALIAHEDVETFRWVFEQWLLCMGGKAPQAILTDQAAAMRRPVADVFPDATHRWCIWHIMQKIPIKLGGLSRYKSLKKALKSVIYNSFSPDEFEKRWPKVIKKFKLHKNEWLAELYDERKMWIPAYMRDRFWAGMRTTQRVESIHSFFDKFVKSHTKLVEFGEKYIAAVEKRMCQERDADDRDKKWHRAPATKFSLEAYFADIYTDEKFLEVSRQCERMTYGFVSRETHVDDNHIEYVINDSVWVYKAGCRSDFLTQYRRLYHLTYNVVTQKALCECRMFETHGIMCRHIFRVLFQNSVTVPPEFYVVHRWKKNVDRKHTRIKVCYHDPRRTKEVKRLDRMQNVFDTLSDKACLKEKKTVVVIEKLKKLIDEIDEMDDDEEVAEVPDVNDGNGTQVEDMGGIDGDNEGPGDNVVPSWQLSGNVYHTLRDPPKRKKRGRPKGSREKGEAEKAIKKSQSKKSKRKDSGSEYESSDDESDVGVDNLTPSIEKTTKSNSKRSEKGKKDKDSRCESSDEESDVGLDYLSPVEEIVTRSKTGYKGRKQTKKKLALDFDSSSDDVSMSF